MSDYTCIRCGREAASFNDHSKIELHRFFRGRSEGAGHNPVFFVVCRFCSEDFEAWIHGDDPENSGYLGVDDWHIPDKQREEWEMSDGGDSAPERLPNPGIAELTIDGRLIHRTEHRDRDLTELEAAAMVVSLRDLASEVEETVLDRPAEEIVEESDYELRQHDLDSQVADDE